MPRPYFFLPGNQQVLREVNFGLGGERSAHEVKVENQTILNW